jgi:hypothetical protein
VKDAQRHGNAGAESGCPPRTALEPWWLICRILRARISNFHFPSLAL